MAAGLTLGLGHVVSFAMDSISQLLGFAVLWLSITSLTHFFVPLTSSSPSHHTWLFLSPLIPLQAQISAEALPHFPFPKMRIPKLPQIPNLQAFTPSPPNTELCKTEMQGNAALKVLGRRIGGPSRRIYGFRRRIWAQE